MKALVTVAHLLKYSNAVYMKLEHCIFIDVIHYNAVDTQQTTTINN